MVGQPSVTYCLDDVFRMAKTAASSLPGSIKDSQLRHLSGSRQGGEGYSTRKSDTDK